MLLEPAEVPELADDEPPVELEAGTVLLELGAVFDAAAVFAAYAI